MCPATVDLAGDLTQSTAVWFLLQTDLAAPPAPPPGLCSDRLPRLGLGESGASKNQKSAFLWSLFVADVQLAWF